MFAIYSFQTLQEKSAVESNWDCVHFDGGDDPSECSQSEQQMTTFLKSMDDIGIDLLSLAHSEEEEGGGGGGDSVAVCPISISFFRLLMPICQDMATISRCCKTCSSYVVRIRPAGCTAVIVFLAYPPSPTFNSVSRKKRDPRTLILVVEFFQESPFGTILHLILSGQPLKIYISHNLV